MCDPATLATAATITKIGLDAHSQAKESRKAKAQTRAAGQEASRELAIRGVEENRATALESLGIQRDASEVHGLLQSQAAAAGVQGQSLRLLLGDLQAESGRAQTMTKENNRMTQAQIGREQGAIRRGTNRQVSQIGGPSALATGLRIGGAVVSHRANKTGRILTPNP